MEGIGEAAKYGPGPLDDLIHRKRNGDGGLDWDELTPGGRPHVGPDLAEDLLKVVLALTSPLALTLHSCWPSPRPHVDPHLGRPPQDHEEAEDLLKVALRRTPPFTTLAVKSESHWQHLPPAGHRP